MIDPAGYGTLAWSDARVLFGWFGPHTAELAPLYAGALTPALALFALVRRWQRGAAARSCSRFSRSPGRPGLAGVLADPIGPLRTITEHQSVRALPLFALALAALAGIAFGEPGARPSPWLVAAFALGDRARDRPGCPGARDVCGSRPGRSGRARAAALAARSGRPGLRARAGGARGGPRAARLRAAEPASAGGQLGPASDAFPAPPATARFLLRQRSAEGPSRFAWLVDDFTRRKQLRFVRGSDHADLLLGMSGTRFGLEDVAGYDPLQLSAYHDAVASSNGRQPSDRHFIWVERAPTRLLAAPRRALLRGGARSRPGRDAGRAAHPAGDDRARRRGAAARQGQPPGANGSRRASSCATPTASSSRRRQARPAGSCWRIRPTRAGR